VAGAGLQGLVSKSSTQASGFFKVFKPLTVIRFLEVSNPVDSKRLDKD
jgi:hypothetical protein